MNDSVSSSVNRPERAPAASSGDSMVPSTSAMASPSSPDNDARKGSMTGRPPHDCGRGTDGTIPTRAVPYGHFAATNLTWAVGDESTAAFGRRRERGEDGL